MYKYKIKFTCISTRSSLHEQVQGLSQPERLSLHEQVQDQVCMKVQVRDKVCMYKYKVSPSLTEQVQGYLHVQSFP